MTQQIITISVVVPVYSGADYLEELTSEIERMRLQWLQFGAPLRLTELIFVDDAARDRSPQLLDSIKLRNDWITVIHLARNYGQHAATIAGILHSSGDWVVTLDEDLQHPPAELGNLLRTAIGEKADIVYGRSDDGAVHENRFRDVGSRFYKWLIRLVTGNKNIQAFSSFRLIRGAIARAAAGACGHDTYFDLSLSWFSERVAVLKMPIKDDRFIQQGKSGYSLRRLMTHARRMFMSSGSRMMRAASLLGATFILIAIIAITLLIFYHLYLPGGGLVRGWASLVAIVVFCSGFIILLLGVVLEYLALLVLNAHGKPIFFAVDRSTDNILREYFSAGINSEVSERKERLT